MWFLVCSPPVGRTGGENLKPWLHAPSFAVFRFYQSLQSSALKSINQGIFNRRLAQHNINSSHDLRPHQKHQPLQRPDASHRPGVGLHCDRQGGRGDRYTPAGPGGQGGGERVHDQPGEREGV